MKLKVFIFIISLLVLEKAQGQSERQDTIHYELRQEVLDAIRQSFGGQQQSEKLRIGFNLDIPDFADSLKMRRWLTLTPYTIWTKYDEDPIYDVMTDEERKAIGIGAYKYKNPFSAMPTITSSGLQNKDFNKFLSILLSPKYRQKRRNQEFVKKMLVPAFDKKRVQIEMKKDDKNFDKMIEKKEP